MRKHVGIALASALIGGLLAHAVWQNGGGWALSTGGQAYKTILATTVHGGSVELPSWGALNPTDLRGVVAKLRIAGFPARVIRAIVEALAADRFAARQKALDDASRTAGYWLINRPTANSAKLAAERRKLAHDRLEFMQDLLGEDAGQMLDRTNPGFRGMFGDVPAEKLPQVQLIRSDYGEMRAEIMAEAQGIYLKRDMEKLALLDAAEREDLSRVLSPDELRDLDLKTGSTSESLRHKLAQFEPTEDEFRAIFDMQRSLDGEFGPLAPNQKEEWQARDKKFDDALKGILTPDRYARYALTNAPFNYSAVQVISRFGLPVDVISNVLDVRSETVNQATAIYSDRSLSQPQRTQSLATLATTAKGRLDAVLGADASSAYQEVAGGWLKFPPNVAPKASPPKR